MASSTDRAYLDETLERGFEAVSESLASEVSHESVADSLDRFPAAIERLAEAVESVADA